MLVGVFGKTQAVLGILCLIKLHSQFQPSPSGKTSILYKIGLESNHLYYRSLYMVRYESFDRAPPAV